MKTISILPFLGILATVTADCLVGDIMYEEGQSTGTIGVECIDGTSYDAIEGTCDDGEIIRAQTVLDCGGTTPHCVQCGPRDPGAALCLSSPEVPERCDEEDLPDGTPAPTPPGEDDGGNGGGGGGGGFDRCDNDQDMQVWMNGGEAGRPEHIDFCATQYNSNGCLADSGCMTTCFQETYGYTEGCAECFGAVPICTVIQGCAMLCAADTSSEECTTCNAPCIQTMNECTGLPITPDSDAPTTSPPTTSSPVTSAPTTSAPTTSAPTTSAPTTSAPTPAPVKGATESPTPSPNTTSPTVNTTPSPSVPDGDGLTDSPTAPDFDDITITTSAPTVKSTPATSAAPSASDAKDGTSPPSSVAQAGTSPPSIAQASNVTLSPVPPPSNVTEEETTQEPTDMPTLTPEITYEPTISYEPTGTPTASPIIVAKPDTDRNKESGASIMSSRVGGFSLAVGIMMTMFVGVF
eukprot:CAMPEP_0183710134 /NCGR_PEP_ID=MMETSP0737-20130205/5966_1 /TAXON_ID=385413 /ORGANISM="Thalassiosira miniscula, Strain CCMP1093" /LENGTH=463 /DNA_ID=CAMNT_0025938357 /DNA_START=35 /DNA_END=1426 /DNA_ORIENTATION=-